jgi:Ni,Fe-hydrogenase III small subunit/Pyruvate/2-oxoacid:ferredoxin oxidoreductase delta subunit
MIDIIKTRLKQKHRTVDFPGKQPVLPDRFRGFPVISSSKCNLCGECRKACPVDACTTADGNLSIDTGKCLFCGKCQEACSSKALTLSKDYRLAVSKRENCVVSTADIPPLASALDKRLLSFYRRSFRIRVVSAGGCNACEADVNVLSTVVFDLSRFGIQYVASPRHADALLVTGPVPENMAAALEKTYRAIAEPKIVVAVGTCAVSGGLFHDHEEKCLGAGRIIPVDFFIPGCPPHPLTILDGLLRILDRIKNDGPARGCLYSV